MTDPRDDKKRIQDTKGGLVKDSYRWILAHGDFQRWRCDEQSRLFWVKGDPGKGKTMLLCGIIEELSSRKPKDREATPLLAYFFCQAADSRINSAMAVVRGLIYMLVLQQPSLVSHVQNEYDHKGKALFEDVNAWATLSNILTNMLQDQRAQGGYVLIDALDECIVDLQRLLNLIVDKSSTSRFKWLVSSRNWPNVEEHLDMTTRKVRLCLELNEESISTAVSIYINHEVDRLARLKKYDDATRDAVRSGLCSGANNTFLWVSLVCRELADLKVKRWHTLKKLHEFPPGLDSLYERMLGQISGLDDVDVCKQILAVVSAVYRPLTLQELTSLVDMPDGISDYESLAEMTRLCGSFLTLRERTVYFVHQSAQEFLLHKARADVFPCGIKHTHSAIFSRSLDVLSAALRTDLYGLRAPGFPIDDVKQPEPDPLAAAQYSCVYWVKHLCQGDSREVQVSVCHRAKILAFLRTHLLHWLEALSLTRGISHGALAISSLESEFEVSVDAPCYIYPCNRESRPIPVTNSAHSSMTQSDSSSSTDPSSKKRRYSYTARRLYSRQEIASFADSSRSKCPAGSTDCRWFRSSGARCCRLSRTMRTGSTNWSSLPMASCWRRPTGGSLESGIQRLAPQCRLLLAVQLRWLSLPTANCSRSRTVCALLSKSGI